MFNSYLNKVDVDFWRDLCVTHGELRHYEAGEEFITAGTVGKYIGYIQSGAMKYECYSEDGTSHVIGLEFAGNFVCDFPFSLYRQKSRSSIIATSPSDIYCVLTSWVSEQMKNDATIREIVAATTVEVFGMVYDRQVKLYTQTPLERLKELLTFDPHLFQIYSLRDIASLLNITPTHLSRLRNMVRHFNIC